MQNQASRDNTGVQKVWKMRLAHRLIEGGNGERSTKGDEWIDYFSGVKASDARSKPIPFPGFGEERVVAGLQSDSLENDLGGETFLPKACGATAAVDTPRVDLPLNSTRLGYLYAACQL